jgi:BirA family biotin operon repressor/biotin-[acetyl-CoA-carboxylase] ligase
MEIIRHHFVSIDSTNTWAKRHVHEMERHKMTLITADEQTAGRGRFNRTWVSPPNQNIYATFCFYWDTSRSDLGNIPQVLALSAVKVLENLGFHPELKWPNDILLSKKKVIGVLCETTPVGEERVVVLGIGVNVNMPLDILERIDRPATSLMVDSGKKFEVETILNLLQRRFQEDLDLFLAKGFSPFLKTFKEKMVLFLGQSIQFHDNQNIIEGRFHRVNDDGSLTMQLKGGELKTFIAGEIL